VSITALSAIKSLFTPDYTQLQQQDYY